MDHINPANTPAQHKKVNDKNIKISRFTLSEDIGAIVVFFVLGFYVDLGGPL